MQITTRAGFTTVAPVRTIRGLVQDTVAVPNRLVRNGTDTTSVLAAGGRWTATVTLTAGTNIFRALTDSAGVRIASDPVAVTYATPQAPVASVTASLLASAVMLDASASSDPQGFPIAGV